MQVEQVYIKRFYEKAQIQLEEYFESASSEIYKIFLLNDIYVGDYENKQEISKRTQIKSTTSLMNRLGYIPLVSTVSGAIRSLTALALIIHTLVLNHVFGKPVKAGTNPITLGLYHLGIGLIEMVPFIGNIIRIQMDKFRINRFNKDMYKLKNEFFNEAQESSDINYGRFPFEKAPGQCVVGDEARAEIRALMKKIVDHNKARFSRNTGTACLKAVRIPKGVRLMITEYVEGKAKSQK